MAKPEDQTIQRLRELEAEYASFPDRRAKAVHEAREAGHTWREIADAIGMTQNGLIAAHQRYMRNRQ